jgi:hypothetical protein
VTSLVLLAFSGRYGYHRDELYYVVAGKHPAWGYDDMPPLLPFIARFTGQSVVLLRLPTVVVVGLTILLVGLLTREMGGTRNAQILAALCWATAPLTVVSGHLFSTTPFDLLCWTALGWLIARWVRTRDDRLLLAMGPVAGIGLLAKNLPLIFCAALSLGLLVAGPRDVFKRWQLWAAGAIALAIWSPNVYWQATHGWPQVGMMSVIREDADWGGRVGLIPFQLLLMGPPLAIVWGTGLWRLWHESRYRFFAWTYVFVMAIVLLTGGREYYPGGAYPALLASGSIALEAWLTRRAGQIILVLNALATFALSLPIYPASVLHNTPEAALNYDAGETVGWQELTATVAGVYHGLTPDERKTAVIFTGNYGEAGAVAKYGPAHGLPAPYSGHLGFSRWGPPPDAMTGPVVLIGGWRPADLESYCAEVTQKAKVDNGYDLDNDEQGTPVYVCRGLKRPWSQIWPELRHL